MSQPGKALCFFVIQMKWCLRKWQSGESPPFTHWSASLPRALRRSRRCYNFWMFYKMFWPVVSLGLTGTTCLGFPAQKAVVKRLQGTVWSEGKRAAQENLRVTWITQGEQTEKEHCFRRRNKYVPWSSPRIELECPCLFHIGVIYMIVLNCIIYL